MKLEQFDVSYTSTNCNQTPAAADWGRNNLICYASSDTVLVYDPNFGSGGKVIDTLIHTKRVNSVKWVCKLDKHECETEVVSAVADGHVCIWSKSDSEDTYSQSSLDHKSNATIVDAIYKDEKNVIVVSAHMDSTVRIANKETTSGNFDLIQTLNFGYHISTALRIAKLPDSNLILAVALDNSKINVYTELNHEFVVGMTLTGHDDWVRGLDFALNEADLKLASSSQDAFIRLWKFSTADERGTTLQTSQTTYKVTLESVLTGHEGWIYSVKWSPDGKQLLSASIDKTLIVWEYDAVTNLWLDKVRLGEVGGNTLGFYTGVFSPDGQSILAYSYHGAFHLWRRNEEVDSWEPQVTVGGHFDEVVDLSWDPNGEFLITTSSDQTTRIHAPWSKDNKTVTWHEIARPQVHGHNLFCLAMLSRYQFASGAEEKVVRVFEAPQNFIENFRRICKITHDKEGDSLLNSGKLEARGASVPSLGLSNKAVFTDDNTEDTKPIDNKNPYAEESLFKAAELHDPPTEETLLENTLWPEVQKLYGHGYEIFSLAASPDGKFLASACKSTSQEHAVIIIWNTENWKMVQKLLSHTLTVVQMEFSPNSQYLLSVSRDRRWSLFEKTENDFQLISTTDKKTGIHSRIIWTCGWTHDSAYFATGSRDAKVVIWTLNRGKERVDALGQCEAVETLKPTKDSAVTALAFAPQAINEGYLMAVGFENGSVYCYQWKHDCKLVLQIVNPFSHSLTVKKLKFRPALGKTGEHPVNRNVLQLASCSSNFQVKIFDIFIDKLKIINV